MKPLFTFLFTLFLLLGTLSESRASHLMGGDLYYRHLGGMDYEVTLVIYRDCFGIPVNTVEAVSINSVLCGQYLVMQVDTIGMVSIDSGCDSLNSWCNGGNTPGMEVYAYRDTVTLTMACTDWVFSFVNCCRNAAITNLYDPGSQDWYVEATLDNLNAPDNDSPVFQELQMPFICANTNFCLDNGAYDADGDSLVYSMINPMSAGGVPLFYNAPFTPTDPFPTAGGHSFDPFTGNHCSTPSAIGAWVVAYRVEQYRNGQLIGHSTRDVQLWDIACPSATLGFTGTVTDSNGVAVSSGDVELYEYGLNIFGSTIVGTTPVNGAGQYSFSGIPYGQYIVRAVPDSINYPGHATTYHVNTHYWTYAEVLSSVCDSTIEADIPLVGFGDLVGSGVVEGYLGDLGIVRADGPGSPWEGVGVILENWPGGDLVAFTRTNVNGNYYFAGIPDGTYRIMIDHPGLPMISYYVITIAPGSYVHQWLTYGALPEGISTFATVGIAESAGMQIGLSPNPMVGEQINLAGIAAGEHTIRVFDGTGRLVFQQQVAAAGGVAVVNVSTLGAGSYLLRVEGAGAVRFVKP